MMKKIIFLICILFYSIAVFPQSNSGRYCGSDELHLNQVAKNPLYKQRFEEEVSSWKTKEAIFKPYYKKNIESRLVPPPPITLSVVFHDMTSSTTPPTANYNAIVTALNTIYGGGVLSPLELNSVTQPDKIAGSDTFIRFCLAGKDKNGDPYNVTDSRHSNTSVPVLNNSDPIMIQSVVTNSGATPRFPTTKYINIYIVDEILGSVAGFASMPSSHGSPTDGIFIERQFLSTTDSFGTNLNYNMNVLAHEMGHYLGLFHVFGICDPATIDNLTVGGYNPCSCDNGNCLFNGDMVCDTPPSMLLSTAYTCGSVSNTCSTDVTPGGQVGDIDDDKQNYMDYGNWLCESHFTDGQIERMQFMINPINGPRKSLLGESICVDCVIMTGCQFSINSPLSTTNNSIVFANTVAFSPTLTGCTASIDYSWSLVSLGTITSVVDAFSGANYTTSNTLPVGNYQLTLTGTSNSNLNCFETAVYNFSVIPVAASCNLSLPVNNTNWGAFNRVSYAGGWTRTNLTGNPYAYPTTIRSIDTDSGFDSPGFDIISASGFSDPNFVGSSFNVPTGLTNVMRVGHILNNGTPSPAGSAYYVSYTFHVSRANCKYKIWSLGMREAQNSQNVQVNKFNMNFSPENAAAFGYVCQYNFTTPATPTPSAVTIGMSENGTMVQTGPITWANSYNFGVNDMFSDQMNNPPGNFVQSGNFRKMTGWNSQVLDFSEFADLDTDITVTFFAHSNDAENSLLSAYSYFGVECMGGGIPADLQMNIPDVSISCEYNDQSCVQLPIPAPVYALNCTQNLGLSALNSGGILYGSYPFGSITVSHMVGSTWTPISGLSLVLTCTTQYNLKFCLTSADAPFEDFQVKYVTLNKTITQIVRVYRGFYHQTPPCAGPGPYGGIADPIFHASNNFLWCPGTPLPELHATDPCFPQDNYEYLWTYSPPSYVSTGITTPSYTVTSNLMDNRCSMTFVRRTKLIDPYCGTPRWENSEVFNVYNLGGWSYTSLPNTTDICLNGGDTNVKVTISNLVLVQPSCIPASLIDTSNSSISIQLFNGTQALGNVHTFNVANFNLSSTNYNVDGGISTDLIFNNVSSGGPIFGVGPHTLSLHITSTIFGCTFTKIIPNYISFNVKPAAIGGTIQLSDTNCTDTFFSIASTNDGFTNSGIYAWEVSNSATGPFFPLAGGGTAVNISNYNFSSLLPPVFIRRKSFGVDQCLVPDYSNVVQINTSSVITDPIFSFPIAICNVGVAPIFPSISNNGVLGTWTPSTVSTTSAATYTFSPAVNQCANPTTVTTSIITNAFVTFNLSTTVCENAIPSLPSSSIEGITGTWSPAAIDQTGDYVFHPDAGQCASDTTVHFSVLQFAIPSFNFPITYCQGQTAQSLPTTSNNAIIGTWVPATVNTTTSGTFPYIFTASVNGECQNVVVNITVNPVITPAFSFETVVCEGIATPILPPVSDNGVAGSWSPSTVSTALSGDYAFTASTPCVTPLTVHITVTQQCQFTLSWGSDVSCEEGNTQIKLDSNIEDGPCIRVCENSSIEYTIHGNTSLILSTEWNISGGVATSETNSSAVVQWDATAAFATLQIVIHFNDGSQKTYNICVEKIEAPHALFGIHPDVTATDVYTCAELEQFFENFSTSTAGNGTMYYNWDFGDFTTSNEFAPSHTYLHTGTYIVNLVVYNGCSCAGTYSVTVHVGKPSIQITCPGVVCENETGHYSVPLGTGSQRCDYQWQVIGGHITHLSSDQSEVDVVWDNVDDSGFGYLSVLPQNCQSCWSTIKVPVVKLHGRIQGADKICMKEQFIYSLPQWPTTDFVWSLNANGTGATLIQNVQRNQIIVQTSSNGTIILSCAYTNTLLGCSGTASITITVQPYARLVGDDIVCENTTFPYSFVDPANNTISSINWTVTGPNSFAQSGTNGSFNFSFPTAGVYNFDVSSPDYCSSKYQVIVQEAIPAPTAIVGPLVTCPGIPVTYSCIPQAGAITHWEVINGTSAGGVTTGNSINVNFDPAATTPFIVKVWYVGENCSSAMLSTTIVRDIPNITFLSGSNIVCGSTYETYSINNVNAESYNWTIDPPTAGSVQSGQNTTSAQILWNQAPMLANVVVKVLKCGILYPSSFAVTIITSPPLTLNLPATICAGTQMNFDFTLTPASTFDYITVDYGDNSELTTLTYAEYTANTHLLDHVYDVPTGNTTSYPISVTIHGAAGCLSPSHATTEIEVSPTPVVTMTPIVDLNLCTPGNPANHIYAVDIQSGIGQTYSIEWYQQGTPGVISTNSSIDAYTLGIGSYWAVVTNNYGCTSQTRHLNVYSNCGGCTAASPIDAVAVNSACGTVTGTLTVDDPNALSVYWDNAYNFPGGIVDVSNSNTFVAHDIYPGHYYLTINANIATDGVICVVSKDIPFTIPYKAGIKYHVDCDNSGFYNVQLFDHSVYYTPITTYEFTTDNGITWVPGTILNGVYSYTAPLTPGTYQVGIRIATPGYPPCEKKIELVLDALPDALFTYDIACAGTATKFYVTHPLTGFEYDWNFPRDATENLQQDPVKTFLGSTPYIATLTVSNQSGCTATTSQVITIQGINMDGTISATPTEACEGSTVTLNYDAALSTDSPIQLKWYRNLVTDIPFATTTPPVGLIVSQPGAYFVHAVDANGCEFTNAPSKSVQFVPTPEAPVIRGTASICPGNSANLYIPALDNIHYVWALNGVVNPVWNDFTEINQQLFAPGMYTYTVTAQSQTATGTLCSGPVGSFTVTVNPQPQAPQISFHVDSCEPYLVTVSIDNVQSGVSYYWSDGDTGPITTITHDGPLQVRAVLDGCSVTGQIDLPLDLDKLVWIFPTGCYDMCKEETAGYLVGPYGEFTYYSWEEDLLNAADGAGTVSPFYGLGGTSHDYALYLQTAYCDKEISSMNMEVNDKCAKCLIEPKIKSIRGLKEKEVCWYQILFSFNNTSGAIVYATFTAPNGEGYFSPNTVLLPSGVSSQLIEFYPASGYFGGPLFIEIHGTGDKGDCVEKLEINLPELCQTGRPVNEAGEVVVAEDLFIIAPNPANESSVLYYEFADSTGEKSIEIFDYLGRSLLEFRANSEGKSKIDCSKFADGTYLIVLKRNGEVLKQLKFLVQNH